MTDEEKKQKAFEILREIRSGHGHSWESLKNRIDEILDHRSGIFSKSLCCDVVTTSKGSVLEFVFKSEEEASLARTQILAINDVVDEYNSNGMTESSFTSAISDIISGAIWPWQKRK